MATRKTSEFLAGVIEGFYGPPWSQAERFQLFDWMAAWGLNTYLYAPKDDLKQRAIWRELYSPAEIESLGDSIEACRRRGLRFIYALSPGLDIQYRKASELDHLCERFGQMLTSGCQNFALLFDDIPGQLEAAGLAPGDSLATAQCAVTNEMFRWAQARHAETRFLFCPTPYCGRMAAARLGGEGYLATIGRELQPGIDVLWTGPEIISREITPRHARELADVLRRKPLLWDNLHANDYDGRRFYCGPYAGRPPEFCAEVAGLLSNPNTEFPLNYVPLRTLAEFTRCAGTWDPRAAYLRALKDWLPAFATVGQPVTLEDLTLLGDAYYLPYEEGPEAEALYQHTRAAVARQAAPPDRELAAFRQRATRLRELCARLAELRHRPLFYALHRRLWELREELDLLERYVELQSRSASASLPCHSDYHLPETYRGGLVARLQRLLTQNADGSFVPTPNGPATPDRHPRPAHTQIA